MVYFHLVSEPNGYLSNWYLSDFNLNGIRFVCVEQYMMWFKAQLFGDSITSQKILESSNPSDMKSLGRTVKNYVDSKWASVRYDVVKNALLAKFSQNDELKCKLLATDGEFAECAVNDLVWGIGIDMRDSARFDRRQWLGQNLLGLALQEVYSELKEVSEWKD